MSNTKTPTKTPPTTQNGSPAKPAGSTELAKPEAHTLTVSEKFVAKIEKQFIAEMGSPVAWTPLQKALAQHLYIKIDTALAALEVKRSGNQYKANDPPITWANVNMSDLTLMAVNRINLELDALVKNHLHVIPYLNKRTNLYDVDLRIGYVGADLCARRFAIDPPVDIRYQLVHESDKFKYGTQGGVAYVEYEQTMPFSPGEVVGGFGYIAYEDPRKNKVVIVEYREFEKAMKASKGTEFWGGEQSVWENNRKVGTEFDEKFRKEMQYKTVVFRVTSKIQLDPRKINADSVAALQESYRDAIDAEIIEEAITQANKQTISLPQSSTATQEEPTTASSESTGSTTASASAASAQGSLTDAPNF